MTRFRRWKFGTVAVMAMAVTTGIVAPVFAPVPANAQLIREQNGEYNGSISIPAGVTIPVTYDKDKVVVTPNETTPLKLRIARNIVDRNRNVLIPEGTEIKGQLEPATRNSEKGSQFVAQELVFSNGDRQSIDASSRIITKKERITKGADTGRVVQDAAIGAGAASLIALITGNHRVHAIEPILGAGAGTAASVLLRRKEAEVVVINPQRGDLNLTLRSNLQLSRY
ncbi:MAG: conjugal transfer protein TrbI [Rhizonema sp. PD37]|nr:conjugal transfer protein TrbI [Rhizonema sp. PD37]